MTSNPGQPDKPSTAAAFGPFAAAMEYMVDAAQRSLLFMDVMRQSGNQYREHLAETAPHVLDYAAEVVVDGRTLDRPVNYVLVRIVPPEGVTVDPARRPFVVVDPRAGHGPGIGGFKAAVRSASPSRPVIPAISSGSCPNPCQARPSRTSRALRRSSSRRSSHCTRRPTASRA